MNKSEISLSDSLQKVIQQTITQELNLSQSASLSYRIIYDDDRRIYKIKVAQHSDFFVLKVRGLKVVKQQDHDIDDLIKEFELLKCAWTSAKKLPNSFGMSKPIKLWKDEKAMLLSGCQGSNFNDWFNQHIFKWAFSSGELTSSLKRCGQWLGHYHQLASKIEPLDGQFSNRSKNLKRMIEFLKANQRHKLSIDRLSRLEKMILELFSLENEGAIAQVHGNFAFRNILHNQEQINLVDFEDAHREHVAFDTGQFLAEIYFKSQFPWLRHKKKAMANAFMNGYQAVFPNQAPICNAYFGYHLIVHLYEHCSRKSPKGLSGFVLGYRIGYLSKLLTHWIKHNQTATPSA